MRAKSSAADRRATLLAWIIALPVIAMVVFAALDPRVQPLRPYELHVRGFAVVFILGILTTVITAVTLTRMMIALWYHWMRPKALPF